MQPLQPSIITSESRQQTLFSYNSASAIASVIGKKVALDFHGGKAASWSKPCKVVAKVEMTDIGKLNVRFISTDMQKARAKALYEEIYCARGNDELYIKEHKTYTKSDRTSCHRFLANQFRLFLHSAAYVLLHSFRSNMLKGTSMVTATFDSIRLKLLKTGARIIERKTKISVHLPTAYPYQWILSKCLAIFEHLRRQPLPPQAML